MAEAVREMSLKDSALLVAALVVVVVTVIYAGLVRSDLTLLCAALAVEAAVIYGEIHRRSAQEQLSLAREQAQMRPELEVADVRLLDAEEVEELQDHIREVREDRKLLEEEEEQQRAAEQERQAREEQKQRARERSDNPWFPNMPSISDMLNIEDPPWLYPPQLPGIPSQRAEPYKGPFPDKVVEIELVNQGRTAAYEVTGWIRFDTTHLQPLDYFLDGYANDEPDGFVRVEVGGGERSTLLPTSNDALPFRIAVKAQRTGDTTIKYEFASRAGKSPAGEWTLHIPDLDASPT